MKIKTHLIKTTFLPASMPHGYGNGYIGIPPEHPWFVKDYDSIEVNVHGGLTYSANRAPNEKPDGFWWIGFDTCHGGDNKFNCDLTYCQREIENLKQQAIDAYGTNTKVSRD
jgi:hypothetical protein